MTEPNKITASHKSYFLTVLKQINEFFPLDIKTVRQRLNNYLTFPTAGLSVTIHAIYPRMVKKIDPFQAEVILRDAPNNISQTEPVIEFAIIDGRVYDWIKSKLTLSIFPNHRMRLEAFNVKMDTGEQCVYDPTNGLVDDKLEYKNHPELITLLRDLISHFPCNNVKNLMIQKSALSDLDRPGNEKKYLAKKELEKVEDMRRRMSKRVEPI